MTDLEWVTNAGGFDRCHYVSKGFHIGKPQGSPAFSSEILSEMGVIGVYRVVGSIASIWPLLKNTTKLSEPNCGAAV